MAEKYFILNSNLLFKRNMKTNQFYIFDTDNNEWVLNYTIKDRYYDVGYDIVEINENDVQDFINASKGSTKSL